MGRKDNVCAHDRLRVTVQTLKGWSGPSRGEVAYVSTCLLQKSESRD